MKHAVVRFQGEMQIPLPDGISEIDAVRYARVMTKFKVDKAELLSIELLDTENDEASYRIGGDGVGTSPGTQAA